MRPMIPRRQFVLFMMTFLVATSLLAQERCLPSDTMAQCFDRYRMTGGTCSPGAAGTEDQPTGVDTGDANLATNTKNFSPLMALAGLLGQGTGDGSGTVVFDVNFHLPFDKYRDSNNTQLQAIVDTQPQISGALRDHLHTAKRDDLLESLKQRIGSGGDYAVRFTYNYTSHSYGRDFEQHEEEYKTLCKVAETSWSKDSAALMGEIQNELGPSVSKDAIFRICVLRRWNGGRCFNLRKRRPASS